MYKIVDYEELIKIHPNHAFTLTPYKKCFFCHDDKTHVKDMLVGLREPNKEFLFRCCSEECTNLYLLKYNDVLKEYNPVVMYPDTWVIAGIKIRDQPYNV